MIIVATTSDGKEFTIKVDSWDDFEPSGNDDMLYLERNDGGVFAALPGESAANVIIYLDENAYSKKSMFFWTVVSDDSFEEAMKTNGSK